MESTAIEKLNTQTLDWTQSAYVTSLNTVTSDRLSDANLPLYTFGDKSGLTMSQYVAAICITRAADLEAQSVTLMETLSENTANLEILAEVETAMLDAVHVDGIYYVEDFTYQLNGKTVSWVEYLRQALGCSFTVQAYESLPLPEYYDDGIKPYTFYVFLTEAQYTDLMQEIESKMDELNSLSQDLMIDLQSLLDKRDQSYTLLTNALSVTYDALRTTANHFD